MENLNEKLSKQTLNELDQVMNNLTKALVDIDEQKPDTLFRLDMIREHPLYLYSTMTRGQFRRWLFNMYPNGMEDYLIEDVLPAFEKYELYEFCQDIKDRYEDIKLDQLMYGDEVGDYLKGNDLNN
jgi:hypothetical protein